MRYPEKIAVDLARAVGVQPGSIAFHAMVGAVSEVIDRCAEESEPQVDDDWESATQRIRALHNKEV